MLTTYSHHGIDAAVKQYETLMRLRAESYDFGPRELNELGRYLLRSGHVEDAIRIFQLNIAAHPSSANSFDELGIAYEAKGQRELAISNYRKALRLNSKQIHAAAALRRLAKK